MQHGRKAGRASERRPVVSIGEPILAGLLVRITAAMHVSLEVYFRDRL
jgi:hypothetical protein